MAISTKARASDPAASDQELLAREFAVVNSQPSTEARKVPKPQLSSFPVVFSLSQVIPDHTQSAMKRWLRKLHRSFKAAAEGNTALAMRLRPKDLWLPLDTHSVPETKGYVWDLRPLYKGHCAVPLQSSHESCPPDTDLNLELVQDVVSR